ncbi:MAG TPA: hypothetical protein EYG71_06310 [Leucothrix sp.]|nr:hypothetical protein [Leucothrix sp.]
MKKPNLLFSIFSLLILLSSPVAFAEEPATKKIKIAFNLFSVDVKHKGKTVTIKRNQDKKNQIVDFYKKTSRGTIQKMYPFKPHTIETLGEREMIDYIKEMSDGDDSIIIIDSRTPDWVKLTGVIPGAVNIPFTEFKTSESTLDIMEDHFNVESGNVFNFKNAKTLVMYCNGNWCAQSPTAIKKLLKMGYPAAKIKYYRGGMHSWAALGLTVIKE